MKQNNGHSNIFFHLEIIMFLSVPNIRRVFGYSAHDFAEYTIRCISSLYIMEVQAFKMIERDGPCEDAIRR